MQNFLPSQIRIIDVVFFHRNWELRIKKTHFQFTQVLLSENITCNKIHDVTNKLPFSKLTYTSHYSRRVISFSIWKSTENKKNYKIIPQYEHHIRTSVSLIYFGGLWERCTPQELACGCSLLDLKTSNSSKKQMFCCEWVLTCCPISTHRSPSRYLITS
jgi:hypothetical protein